MILTRRYHWRTFEFTPYIGAVVVGLIVGLASFMSPVIGLGLVAGIIFVIAAAHRPMLLFFLHALAIIFLSGVPRGHLMPFFVPNEPVLVLVAGLGFLIVLVSNIGRRDAEKISPWIIVVLAVYFITTSLLPTIIYMMRGWRLGFAEIFSLLAPAQYLVVFWLFANLPRSTEQRFQVIHFMIFCASIVSFFGLLQAANVSFVLNLLQRFYPSNHTDMAAEAGRVISILGAWNSLGNFLMINIVVILSMPGLWRRGIFNLNLMSSLFLSAACLLASGSFASIGGLFIAVAITKWFDRRGMKLLLYLAIGAVVAAVLLLPLISTRLDYQFGGASGGTPQTLEYRFYLWETVFFPVLLKNNNFVLGITPFLNGGIFTWAWTENMYLYLLIRSGLVSLVGHLLWVGLTMVWLYRIMRQGDDFRRTLAITLIALFAALTVMGMTNEVFTNSGSIDFFWMYLGLVAKSNGAPALGAVTVDQRKPVPASTVHVN